MIPIHPLTLLHPLHPLHMDLYAENILDHYRHPRNKDQGPRTNTKEMITHTEANLSCGDEITLSLNIQHNRISTISWDGTGCAISQAAMSLLSEELHGKTIAEVEALTPQNVYDILGVPIGPRRVKCALLGLHVLKNTLRKHQNQPLQNWTGTIGSDRNGAVDGD